MSKELIVMKSSRTHSCRRCWWTQVGPGLGIMEPIMGSKGTLKAAGKYLVREHEATWCRRFKVTKEAKEGGDSYWVSIGEKPEQDTCDCQGFEAHAVCKHADGIRAIIEEGKFVPRSDNPVTCFFDEREFEEEAS